MKRLFRPRNLLIVLAIGGVVFFVVRRKQSEQLANLDDDQVREMVHDRVAGKVDAATESDILENVAADAEELASSATGAE